jgi:acyl transferase domain-containing protein
MYWARHLRLPVRFVEALRTLWADPTRTLLEVGPRSTCATLARQLVTDRSKQVAIASLDDRTEAEWPSLLRAVGQLWLGGAPVDWEALQAIGRRRLVSLPSYPFARDRHWLEPAAPAASRAAAAPLAVAAPSLPAAAPYAAVEPEAVPAFGAFDPANGDALASVVSAQLSLMEAQLETLRRLDPSELDASPGE